MRVLALSLLPRFTLALSLLFAPFLGLSLTFGFSLLTLFFCQRFFTFCFSFGVGALFCDLLLLALLRCLLLPLPLGSLFFALLLRRSIGAFGFFALSLQAPIVLIALIGDLRIFFDQ